MDTSFSLSQCKEAIRQKAVDAGFTAVGFAEATTVDTEAVRHYDHWLAEGRHGSMGYMANHRDLRRDPRTLLDGARTVICLAMNYFPTRMQSPQAPQFAYYAYGRDYHDVVRQRLTEIAEFIRSQYGGECRCCVDTAPLRERYWAQRAGIGFVGRNNQLIVPRHGSYFFLGEILTTIALPPDNPLSIGCGTCRRCVDACPVGAINTDGRCLDARLCISCMTIEHRGDLPDEVASRLGNRVYGCDECQKACPHNRFATPTTIEEFAPSDEFLSLTTERLSQITEEDYRHIFRRSAVKRAKYAGLMRNVEILIKNRE